MNILAMTNYEVKNAVHPVMISLDEKREFVDFQMFENEEQSLMDQIFVARVDNIVPGIQAAFVKISPEQTCFLPLEDAKSPVYTCKRSKKERLCVGDEILVQVVKDAVKTKEPIVSANLSLYGTYCVLTTKNTTLGISRKIANGLNEQLQEMLQTCCQAHEEEGYGIVIRTNAKHASVEAVCADVQAIIQQFRTLKTERIHSQLYSCVYEQIPSYVRSLQSLNFQHYEKIRTDDSKMYENIQKYLPFLKDSGQLELYEDKNIPLHVLYHISGNIDKLLAKRVWLSSGANIIIEHTEALTVIDVNSAKNQQKSEEMYLKVNQEAAIEIARQLRLRNISGMIIIDFINMRSEEQTQQLISCLKQELKKDSVPCQFIDMTALGLAEVTRKKVFKSLREIV